MTNIPEPCTYDLKYLVSSLTNISSLTTLLHIIMPIQNYTLEQLGAGEGPLNPRERKHRVCNECCLSDMSIHLILSETSYLLFGDFRGAPPVNQSQNV